MFRKNSQDLTPSRKSSQDLSTSPTPSGQRRTSLLMRKVSMQALTVHSVLRQGTHTWIYKDFQNLFIKINRKKIKIARLLRKKRDLQSYQNLNIFLWYHDCEILVDRSDDNLLTVRSLSTCTLMAFCSFWHCNDHVKLALVK